MSANGELQSIEDLEKVAAEARRDYSALEHISHCCREIGPGLLTERFWARFGEASALVQKTQRDVAIAKERQSRERMGK